MTYHGKLTSKGQTTIPVDVREAMQLIPGDRIVYEQNSDGSFTVRKMRSAFELIGIARPFIRDKSVLGLPWAEVQRRSDEARIADHREKLGLPKT